MAEFTLTDKGLMLRAARILEQDAKVLEGNYGPAWASSHEGAAMKLVYDRLLRDARDMRTLAKRLEALHPPFALPPKSSVPPTFNSAP